MPQNLIIKDYIHLFSWKLYVMFYSWNVFIVCTATLLYYHSDFCFVQPFSLSICRSNRGSCLCLMWLYKIALKLMHYVVASLHMKALDYFNLSGFSANVVFAENWFVCVLLSCCYTCFVYASTPCYKTFQVQVLWWRMIKIMLMVQEHIQLMVQKAVMISYAWLQLFLFFHNPLWVKYAFFVPLN